MHRPTLDDVFLTLTGRSLRDEESSARTDDHPRRTGMSTRHRRRAMTARSAPRAALFRDTGIVMARELRPVLADPFSLVFGMIQPLVFLGLFGPLLAGSVGGRRSAADVWQWFVPSILVMTALFGTSTTGANLLFELQTGAHERMLVTPLSRPSLLVGRSLKEMVPLGRAGTGHHPGDAAVRVPTLYPLGALVGLAMLAVFGVGLGSLSYALAIAVRKQEWMFWVVQQTLLFPLMILSGMLLPLETGPGWMRVAAAFNPLAYVVDAERALFAGEFTARRRLGLARGGRHGRSSGWPSASAPCCAAPTSYAPSPWVGKPPRCRLAEAADHLHEVYRGTDVRDADSLDPWRSVCACSSTRVQTMHCAPSGTDWRSEVW